jgi:hypothetical protein
MLNADDIDVSAISPEQLTQILTRDGWQVYGGRPDMYSRWRSSESEDATTLVVPVNEQMADYSQLLKQAVKSVVWSGSEAGRILLQILQSARFPGDAIRFRRETSTLSGQIPWPVGESLIVSARLALQASAKTCKSRKSYFGNSNAKLARAYMNSVLMGQTENSSYVVTAYAPAQEPLYENLDEHIESEQMLPGMPTTPYVGRDVTSSLVEALLATQEAISHYEVSSSFSGFEVGVQRGISYEIVTAIQGMLAGSEGADVSVAWEASDRPTFDAPPKSVVLEFEPRWYRILERASHQLAVTSPSEIVTVIGTVTLLDRPRAGQPGVIRIEVISGSPAKNLRVRLEPEQYELALETHRGDAGIVVTGRQERDGRLYWLYDPRDIRAMDIEPLAARVTPRSYLEEPSDPQSSSDDPS